MPTTPRHFRLTDETVAEIDRIVEWMNATTPGICATRTDVVRVAVKLMAKGIPREKKSPKKSPKTC